MNKLLEKMLVNFEIRQLARLEKMLRVDEDSGLKSLQKIYNEYEKGLDPDPSDLFNALSMMEKFCKDYLKWYATWAGPRKVKKYLPDGKDYQKRLEEIQQALKGHDTGQQMIALDNIVNQCHMDFLQLESVADMIEGEDDFGIDYQIGKMSRALEVIARRPSPSVEEN